MRGRPGSFFAARTARPPSESPSLQEEPEIASASPALVPENGTPEALDASIRRRTTLAERRARFSVGERHWRSAGRVFLSENDIGGAPDAFFCRWTTLAEQRSRSPAVEGDRRSKKAPLSAEKRPGLGKWQALLPKSGAFPRQGPFSRRMTALPTENPRSPAKRRLRQSRSHVSTEEGERGSRRRKGNPIVREPQRGNQSSEFRGDASACLLDSLSGVRYSLDLSEQGRQRWRTPSTWW
jgi:hypothetical protein